MSEIRTSSDDPHGPGSYRISVRGHLAQRWSGWFDDLTLTNESDGTTVLSGVVVDQAALHGLLRKVRDTGLPLVSVTRVHTEPSDSSADARRDVRTTSTQALPSPTTSAGSPAGTASSPGRRATPDARRRP